MGQCRLCATRSRAIARILGVCGACIQEQSARALQLARAAHRESRETFDLPAEAPDTPGGIRCPICVNACRIGDGETGYCGIRKNQSGRLVGAGPKMGYLSWYHDPLPTNCVGDRICPGGTGAGYPEFAYRCGPEHGYRNLAVFFNACTFDCLYCQNWHFKEAVHSRPARSVDDLVGAVNDKTACICFFGGDPSAQFPFSLKAARMARETAGHRILRICWETNGSMAPKLLDSAMELALASGGLVKFDLKAFDDTLHRVLTGVTNRRTLDNFRRAAVIAEKRPNPPGVMASTLMVPGYVEAEEIGTIAQFIADTNPDIPYRLLAFHPQFCVSDLPLPTREMARACLEAARGAGLHHVNIGNRHLLT